MEIDQHGIYHSHSPILIWLPSYFCSLCGEKAPDHIIIQAKLLDLSDGSDDSVNKEYIDFCIEKNFYDEYCPMGFYKKGIKKLKVYDIQIKYHKELVSIFDKYGFEVMDIEKD